MKRIPLLEALARTPWFMLERDGPPARAGVFETSSTPIVLTSKSGIDAPLISACPVYRNHLGSGMWAEAQPTPSLAAQCTTATQARPIFWRGLTQEAA